MIIYVKNKNVIINNNKINNLINNGVLYIYVFMYDLYID